MELINDLLEMARRPGECAGQMIGGLAVRIGLLVTAIFVTAVAPSRASTIRMACYGWDSAPVSCFDEATGDTLVCTLPNMVGPEFNGSIYYFGFISMNNQQFCSGLSDTEADSSCTYDLTAWFEPGSVGIGHVFGPGGGDQAAHISGQGWQGHVPTDFVALRLEYQQRTPCNDTRTILIPIRWMPDVPPGGGGSVVAWGANWSGQCNVPEPNADFIAIAGGQDFGMGLKTDGSMVAWGDNSFGQCNLPGPNTGFVAIDCGYRHGLGLRTDGSIAAWGENSWGQCSVPAPNVGFVSIAGGGYFCLGLKMDGTVVAWGNNAYGQCNVPTPNSGFIAVAAAETHSLGLKADGSVVAWGLNSSGECNVPLPNTGFVAIAGGERHSLGLKADGSVVAWGWNAYGECSVPQPNTGFVAVAAGTHHSLGLKADGSIVAWGDNERGQCNVPVPNSGFLAVAAGAYFGLGLRGNPGGACCFTSGACAVVAEEECQPPNVYRGDGTICQPNWCLVGGACCQLDGSCIITTEVECPSPGTWHGVGTTCDLNPCLTGACCLYVACEVYSSENCASHGGVFMGNGTLCEPNPCVSGVKDAADISELRLTATPNPSTGQVTIRYGLPRATVVTIEVFDAAGSLVRRLAEGQHPAGAFSTPWDGRDDNGRELPTGVYFARVVTGHGSAMGKTVIAR